MERNSSKEYSILATMSKEQQQALKTCFDELHLRFDTNRQWTEKDNIDLVFLT